MNDHSIQVRVTGFILEDQTELTLNDICRACAAEAPLIVEMVDEGVLAPSGDAPAQWRFTGVHIRRARTALNQQRDLGVNLPGAALAIQLIEELDSLRAQLHRLAGD
jgi:chaperone modulatory protein CbpM